MLSCLALLTTLLTQQATSAPALPQRPMIGAFFGVSEYPEGQSDLHGDQDSRKYKETFQQLWGMSFSGSDTFPGATKAQILGRLDEIIRETKGVPEGQQKGVVIVFSGHGSLVVSPDSKRLQACLLPSDVRMAPAGGGVKVVYESVVTVEEFRSRIDAIRANGVRNITVILDSCFSGGMSRSGAGVDRSVVNVAAESSGLPRPNLNWQEDREAAPIFVFASKPSQQAYEFAGTDDDPSLGQGKLLRSFQMVSRRMRQELSTGERKAMALTVSELRSAIASEMSRMGDGGTQNPVIIGQNSRLLFDTRLELSEPGFEVVRSGGAWYVNAGSILGIRPGFRFALVHRSEKEYNPANVKNILVSVREARDITPNRSLVIPGQRLDINPADYRAFIAEAAPDVALVVNLDLLQGLPQRDWAREAMTPTMRAKRPDEAGFDVIIVPPGSAHPEERWPRRTNAWSVISAAGNLEFSLRPVREGNKVTEFAPLVGDSLAKENWQQNMRIALRNAGRRKAILAIQPSPDLVQLEVEAVLVRVEQDLTPEGNPRLISARVMPATEAFRQGQVRHGDYFALRARSTAPENLTGDITTNRYLTVLDVNPRGRVNILWGRNTARQAVEANRGWFYIGLGGRMVNEEDVLAGKANPLPFSFSEIEDGVGPNRLRIFGTREVELSFEAMVWDDFSPSRSAGRGPLQNILDAYGNAEVVSRSASTLDRWSLKDIVFEVVK